MRRTRSATRKLVGWGILAGVAVVIVGIFLIARAAGPARSVTVAPTSTASTASSAMPLAASRPSAPTPPSAATSSELAASSSSASSSELVVVDAAAMDQGARKALLNTLIRQGVFTGVEAIGSPPKVGVTPLFQGLDSDLQRQFIAAVYTYVNNGAPGTDPLEIIDATTGKVIGHYTEADGLRLL